MSMLTKVYNLIVKNEMLSAGDTVVCGLSGGADSVALLLVLNELKEKLNIKIQAIHVNHCLRGAESDRDENFCRKLCQKFSIPFKAVSCDVKSISASEGISVEEAARKLRYKIFEDNSQGKKLATAHNANDNLETVILNLSRGTGVKGLSGIPVIRGSIVRPLLTVTRQEIEEYLSIREQSYVTDSTNLSDDYTRNKIRHKIVPLLSEINTSINETSVNTINNVREENEFIEKFVDEAEEKCRKNNKITGLSMYDAVIRKRCISRLLADNHLPYSFRRLEEVDYILKNGGKINISGSFFLQSKNDEIELKEIKKPLDTIISTEITIGKDNIIGSCNVKCDVIECDNLKKIEVVNKKSTFYVADYDKIRGKIIVRTRKFGDRIKLKGRDFTSSVKKLINEKIPADERADLLFIEDECGTILAEKIGIADRISPDTNTVRFLKISFIRS